MHLLLGPSKPVHKLLIMKSIFMNLGKTGFFSEYSQEIQAPSSCKARQQNIRKFYLKKQIQFINVIKIKCYTYLNCTRLHEQIEFKIFKFIIYLFIQTLEKRAPSFSLFKVNLLQLCYPKSTEKINIIFKLLLTVSLSINLLLGNLSYTCTLSLLGGNLRSAMNGHRLIVCSQNTNVKMHVWCD